MKDDVESIRKVLSTKHVAGTIIRGRDLLSSGSTLLNLACSGKWSGAFLKGNYYHFVGDSQAGKTWLALATLAEASISKAFGHYRLIYDNGENGALMNIERFFGSELAEKLEPPSKGRDDVPVFSTTSEELYFHIDDAVEYGEPFIYVQDSLDVLDAEADAEKFTADKRAYRKGKETKGTYAMDKAKVNSSRLRRVINGLRKTGSILFVISQTRDNIGPGATYNPRTYAGGRSLKFYAQLQIWYAVKKKLTKEVRGKERQLGILSKIDVKKNRLTGTERSVEVPIYHSYGADDLGSCIDYLIAEGHWKKLKGVIRATDFDFVGKRNALIHKIEEEGMEKDLRSLVADVWNEIEEECSIKRKPRYG